MGDMDGFDSNVWSQRQKYFHPPERKHYYKDDNTEAVRTSEAYLIRECEQQKLNWSTIDKYAFARKMGVYKDYFDALAGKRLHR